MKGFDAKRFLKEKFTPRHGAVQVPDLKEFFPAEEEPIWQIRGLTGQEIGRARHAAENRDKVAKPLVKALMKGSDSGRQKEVEEMLGINDDVPFIVALKIEYVILGSILPECSRELAVNICKKFPIEFYDIAQAIEILSGKGHDNGKIAALWKDPDVQSSLAICHERKRFLFEARPDIIPEGFQTATELGLWALYYEDLADKRKAAKSANKE